MLARLGLIAEPIDAALTAAMQEYGVIPNWTAEEKAEES